ncbi:uncharacterized protein PHACADRAFT_211266 [Phanerochaete carnosa HHB-10118-sp]|uniref:Uncharacterized protein n=1 Tax=Phanerochaete carnosa (strain HHB-10118-sp) TaxID=650164 RepID=K5VQ32_PHACS|nr:uncharacterized protein PHACADRAFT_211266 [Phanerochaete carnosa HHB-10118-sp]EKM53593.1 hypothetical protein PHACADRAFT_211266 [Phanerochaete carnosa HHB-10118-sp]
MRRSRLSLPRSVPMTPEPEHSEPYIARRTDDCPRTPADKNLLATCVPTEYLVLFGLTLSLGCTNFQANKQTRVDQTTCTGRQIHDRPPPQLINVEPQISVPTPSTIALCRGYWPLRKGLDRSKEKPNHPQGPAFALIAPNHVGAASLGTVPPPSAAFNQCKYHACLFSLQPGSQWNKRVPRVTSQIRQDQARYELSWLIDMHESRTKIDIYCQAAAHSEQTPQPVLSSDPQQWYSGSPSSKVRQGLCEGTSRGHGVRAFQVCTAVHISMADPQGRLEAPEEDAQLI